MDNNDFKDEFLQTLQHQTPYFLFSKQRLIDKYKEYEECFPGAMIQYAMKANAEPEILEILAGLGSGFEVASLYELEMLKPFKVKPEKIVYGTSVKPMAHIREFADYGVDMFAFDSFPELEKIAAAAPGSKVYVRVRVNDAGSVFKFSEKFGTEIQNTVALMLHAKELGLQPYGISFHVGSQASNPMAWANALQSLSEPLNDLKKLGIEIQLLNIGGGYPCAYASAENELTLQEIAKNTLEQYQRLPYQPKLMLEPGRGMVATTAVAVASVIARVERATGTWLFLDAGVYNGLFETMAYQGSTRYKMTSLRPSYDAGEMLFEVAGPTGDSPDIITREALLPKDIGVGDKLVIHDVGAYSLVCTSPFNGFPKPGVYFV